MYERMHRSMWALALVGLMSGTACQQSQEAAEDDIDAETGVLREDETAPAAEAPAMDEGTDVGMEEDADLGMEAGAAEVSVTNSMSHPMVVKADWGQGENELGTVEGNETKSFDVEAPAGSQVTLTASDAQASHSTSGSVKVGEDQPANWTIQ